MDCPSQLLFPRAPNGLGDDILFTVEHAREYASKESVMNRFSFNTTPQMIFQEGAATELGSLATGAIGSHVLFVTDATIRGLGLADEALASFKQANIAVTIYDDVEVDPPAHCVEAAVAVGREAGVTGVIGFGGGSVMDTAKMAAYLLRADQPLAECYGVEQCTGDRLPLVLVPTTAGTGSEMTPISVLTKSATEKMGVSSHQLLPDLAVLDPILTLTVPPEHTAATGIDAMVHAIEAYTTKLKKNPISDALALEALRLLSGNIRAVMDVPNNLPARGNMLLGSMLAGQSFANAPCAAVHALAYPLGARFHVTHGLSNAMLLAPVLRFNQSAAEDDYARLGEVVFGDRSAEALIAGFADLGPSLGLPAKLREIGIAEGDLAIMAADSMAQTRLLQNNPRDLAEADALEIYRAAW